MENGFNIGKTVAVIKLSGRTEKHTEDGENITRMGSSQVMKYMKMAN